VISLKCRENLCRKAFSRLATVRGPAVSALILSLIAVAVSSCGGGSDAKLLPGTTAREITENLSRVRQYATEGECVGATNAAAEVNVQIEALHGVDPKLKQALERGAEKLGEAVADCEETTTEATTAESETTKPERTEPPGQEKKAEREREEEEKALEAEERAEEEETPPAGKGPSETPPASPGEGGGGPSGGVGPGEAVGQGGD
jgi:hypothetical protein